MCALVLVSSPTPPNRWQIFMAAATRTPQKSRMMPLCMQLNLRSSCSMSNGPKLTSPASRWSALSPYAIVTIIDWFEPFIQGGGILAAFTSFFPDLVDSKVMLIAPTGLVEVSFSVNYTACFRPHLSFQSKDLSKTTKFMSSPFVQSITSSSPFRVRLSITCVRRSPLSNLDQFYLQRLANSSSSDPVSEVPFPFLSFSIGLIIVRVDRANTICTPSRLQCSDRILS